VWSYVVGPTRGHVLQRSGPSKGGVTASQLAQVKNDEGWTSLHTAMRYDALARFAANSFRRQRGMARNARWMKILPIANQHQLNPQKGNGTRVKGAVGSTLNIRRLRSC